MADAKSQATEAPAEAPSATADGSPSPGEAKALKAPKAPVAPDAPRAAPTPGQLRRPSRSPRASMKEEDPDFQA